MDPMKANHFIVKLSLETGLSYDEVDAYVAGVYAYQRGESVNNNPWVSMLVNADLASIWEDGFEDASTAWTEQPWEHIKDAPRDRLIYICWLNCDYQWEEGWASYDDETKHYRLAGTDICVGARYWIPNKEFWNFH